MHLESPSPTTSFLVTGWQTHWSSLLALALQLAVVAGYVVEVKRLARAGVRWPPLRTALFVLGMAVVAYAFEGGVSVYDRDNFTVHVVQLLLLVDIAPPLLAYGAPARLVAQAPGPFQAGARRLVSSRALRALTNPLVVFVVYMATMYAYFLSPVYRFSVSHPAFLTYVQVQFLLSGALMWWVVVGRDALPRPLRFGPRFALVVAAVPFIAYLGVALGDVQAPLYPAANTLHDTRSGGDVLWGLAEIFVVVMLAYLFVEWAREEERRALAADERLESAARANMSHEARTEVTLGGTSDN